MWSSGDRWCDEFGGGGSLSPMWSSGGRWCDEFGAPFGAKQLAAGGW
jgi:hypothetical protein